MSRLLLLDLFCGAGGAAMGYYRAGFQVVGVDIEPQPSYPFEFYQADVMDLGPSHFAGFDVVHASPPCQAFTAYRRRLAVGRRFHPDLVGKTRQLLIRVGLPYVIENVRGAPLPGAIQLCGSSFGLDVQRHRWFETNPMILAPLCDHSWQTPRFPQATNRKNLRRTVEVGAWRASRYAPAAMGIDWMSNEELSEAIPPAYTEWIGQQLLRHLEQAA